MQYESFPQFHLTENVCDKNKRILMRWEDRKKIVFCLCVPTRLTNIRTFAFHSRYFSVAHEEKLIINTRNVNKFKNCFQFDDIRKVPAVTLSHLFASETKVQWFSVKRKAGSKSEGKEEAIKAPDFPDSWHNFRLNVMGAWIGLIILCSFM